MQTQIDAHIVHPEGTHKSSIIWLHGLGADGHDFAPVVPELNLDIPGVKFMFPHAPVRPITINNGFPMRGWYDILTLDADNFIDDMEGIRASSAFVHELIAAEMAAGIEPDHIILAGFSQGGAIALFAGLTAEVKLGGIIGLSTYLPAAETVAQEKRPDTPPILMVHGAEDMTIPLEYADRTRIILFAMGCELDYHIYRMGHTFCPEEVTAISEWLKMRLK